jgi:hypothetical protein
MVLIPCFLGSNNNCTGNNSGFCVSSRNATNAVDLGTKANGMNILATSYKCALFDLCA